MCVYVCVCFIYVHRCGGLTVRNERIRYAMLCHRQRRRTPCCLQHCRPALQLQKRAMKELRAMFDTTSYFDSEQITAILMVRS